MLYEYAVGALSAALIGRRVEASVAASGRNADTDYGKTLMELVIRKLKI